MTPPPVNAVAQISVAASDRRDVCRSCDVADSRGAAIPHQGVEASRILWAGFHPKSR